MDLLQTFGVKPILLIAQAVNFLILLFILKKFLYRPILKVLAERKNKIELGLKNAEEIEKRLQGLEQEKETQMSLANQEVAKMLEEATLASDKIIQDAKNKASEDIKRMIDKAQAEIEVERDKMQQTLRADLANLVVIGLEKVAGKVLDDKAKKQILEESIKNL